MRTSYRDFLALERATPDPTKVAFWRRNFDAAPASTAGRFGDRPVDDYRIATVPVPPIPLATAQGLRRTATAARVPCATAVLALGLAASPGMGSEEMEVVLIRANRDHPRLRSVVGFVAEFLPIRVPVGGDPSFVELMSRTHRAWLTSLANAIPFREIADAAGVGTWPPHAVSDLGFNYFPARPPNGSPPRQDAAVPPLGEPGSLTQVPMRPRVRRGWPAATWDLFVVETADGGLHGGCHTTEQQECMLAAELPARIASLLTQVVEHPDRPLARLVDVG